MGVEIETTKHAILVREVESQPCPRCGCHQPHQLVLYYDARLILFVGGWVENKRYLLSCTKCGFSIELEAEEVERALPSHPIPFKQRQGLNVLLIVIAVFWVVMFIIAGIAKLMGVDF